VTTDSPMIEPGLQFHPTIGLPSARQSDTLQNHFAELI
jgi:hypothetical protein